MHAILIAIGSAGDVFPFIGLARTLKLRGHRVSLCTIPVFRDAVEQHGIAFVPLSDELTYRRTMGDPRLWDPKTSFGVLWQAIAGMIEPVYEYVSAQRHDAAFFSRPARHGDLVMIELLSESLEGLSAAMIAELGRYRHQVFIEKLGWDVVSTSRVRDQEFDQFDHPQTRYIVAMGRQGICGCARLLPTTDAYLLKEVFAYLCSETPPSDPSVWELSRYAASAADDPQLAMKIFWSSLQCAWYLGASSVVAVTTTAMERYFVRNGVILQRLGPPQKVKGETLVAISFPAYQERGLEMLLRYHPEWLQGVPLSMAV